jgi:hypothetical protein
MSDHPTVLDPARLVRLLGEQRDVYARLKELSAQQRGLIAGDRSEALLAILGERHALVKTLVRLNDELAPYRRAWDDVYAGLPAAQRRDVSQLLKEVNDLLRVILTTDQEDGAMLAARKQAVAGEIVGLAGTRSASSAYARAARAAAAPAADLNG